ncbi:MAG: penicillin acylase family protein [Acidobacteria bacterium]|nr:penicillin acylase family protein [Acidobacteriota bacterium]MBI3663283.1 penicillin acylase family protein [Acidobacteriota bacterium]
MGYTPSVAHKGDVNKILRALRYVISFLIVAASLGLLAGWWIAHRALPQLDGEISLSILHADVTVDRDRWGVPRIKAASLEDLVTAQGYVLAQDRLWQMDVLRRSSAGELAEILGEAAIETDRENRILGLRAAAEKCAAEMDADTRGILGAYARGVNQYIAERQDNLPVEFRVLGYKPRPWTPADSLLVGAYMYKYLTSSWEAELNRGKITERLGAELAREIYAEDSSYDHYIVGAEAPAQPTPPRKKTAARPASGVERDLHVAGMWREALDVLEGFEKDTEFAMGSNNWVVSGEHTYSGKPLLANDTHLGLAVPSTWYIVHLTAPGWNVKGFALPGVPLVIIGHNDRIAWGFTNNGADVQDLYIETFNPENPREYRVNGKWMPAKIRKEVLHIKGRADLTLDVAVTRHGPVVLREGNRGYALRWTATEAGGLSFAYPWVGKARNWEEFREAMRRVAGPAQNAVYGDVDGNIGYLVAANIPIRKNGKGEVPVPGDTDDCEWTGNIPYEELPVVFNPPGGIIATANAKVAGPGYKRYLTDGWMAPYRTERLYQLLAERKNLRPEDFIAMQTDLVSIPHRLLADHLRNAVEKHRPQDARTGELIARLKGWNGRATRDSVPMAFLEFTRRAVRRKILQDKLGKDAELYRWWRSEVFFQNVLRQRPAHWLPKEYAGAGSAADGYDTLLIRMADEAVKEMARMSHKENVSEWNWGRFMPLRMNHPLGPSGLAKRHLSIGPIQQAGSTFTVKQTGVSLGPAMRFVADLANLDNSLMNITMGQSGQYLSRHYRDQFPEWYEGRGIHSVFSDTSTERATIHHLRLRPGGAPAK